MGFGSITTNAAGEYSFANLPAGGPYFVTPSKAGFRFTPDHATIENLISDVPAVNFASSFALGQPPRPRPTPYPRPTPR